MVKLRVGLQTLCRDAPVVAKTLRILGVARAQVCEGTADSLLTKGLAMLRITFPNISIINNRLQEANQDICVILRVELAKSMAIYSERAPLPISCREPHVRFVPTKHAEVKLKGKVSVLFGLMPSA